VGKQLPENLLFFIVLFLHLFYVHIYHYRDYYFETIDRLLLQGTKESTPPSAHEPHGLCEIIYIAQVLLPIFPNKKTKKQNDLCIAT